jgi:hypothetical protein
MIDSFLDNDPDNESDALGEAREEILACYELLEECKALLERASQAPQIAPFLRDAARLVRRIEVRVLAPAGLTKGRGKRKARR